ncbi:proline and serine-rich protein 3 [Alligator sinensis]|uniref:Proline and serine-rich protein 3 n=1 Tax=Alligator sinensis TaxID=38654 RepID=A0A3Q0FR43_ALLSI|nr:proline and serine-rich protein 3 [Alligator sinensis]
MEVASEGTSGVWRTPGVPPWRGDTAWLGLRAASSSRDSGPQAPQQGVGPAGGGGACPPADHAPIQLAPAPAPTLSWMPGEDGESSHDAPGPSRGTPVTLSRDASGPDRTVQRPSSHDALGPDGMVQRPSSHDALGSNGMAQRSNSHDASGPSRWTPVTLSHDALGLDGTAHRPNSHDAPGPSRWTLVTPSCDALGPDGTTQRPSSHDAVGPDGMVQRPSSHDTLGSNGTAQRPNSQDASGLSRWTPLTLSHDALGPDGMAQSPNSHDALGPSRSLPPGLSHNALGRGRPSSQAASWPGGPAQETASHDAWRRDPQPRSRARLRQGGRGGPECPPQAVRRALGQVIAERLLSPPLGQEESVGPLGQEEQPVAPLGQESFPPGQEPAPHTQLLGLAARLLQEAEDSDGTEFEADPLLQVLRGQREVLRRCLRAVDLKVMSWRGGGSAEHDGSPC